MTRIPPALSGRAAWLAAATLAGAFFLQTLAASREHSLTWDEPTFFVSGYTYLTRGDFRMNPEAPPLLQELTALPLLFMNLETPPADDPHWEAANQVMYAYRFVYGSGADVRSLAFWVRLPVAVLGTALVLALCVWGRTLYGAGPALLATALAACCPNLIAHAGLATTDLGCAAFMFVAVWAFARATRRGRLRDWGWCGAATGAALLTKFTALLLGPIYVTLSLALLFRRRVAFGSIARGGVVIALASTLAIGVGYNFSFDLSLYRRGLESVYLRIVPGYRFYLLGAVSSEPWWYYHLVAFVLKTPLPTLALLVLAAARLVRDRDPGRRDAAVFLLVPACAVLAVSCFDRANIGFRRILPALPFLLLFTAEAAAAARRPAALGVVVALVLWSGVEAARIYPDHLSYFNAAAGGSERGPYLLDDSNVDWGQDLPALAAWQRAHPQARPIKFTYFGTAQPAVYGVDAVPMTRADFERPGPGVYAVSVHRLVSLRKQPEAYLGDVDWLTLYTPIGRAGHSIWIYEFP